LDDEDEVLAELAEHLGLLSEYIGGNSFAHILLNPLEKLCYIDETTIKDKVYLRWNSM
jgi:serine/threonine-protein phosphatase 2A regulatory subunit A